MGIPTSHADLLDRPLPAALTTHFAGGRLQSSVVWFWRDDDAVCLSTMAEFVKATNLRERPRATLAVWDADGRWLALRSAAEEVRQPADRALADCDDVGFRYCGVRPYFGAVVPAEWASAEHPVTFRLTPGPVSAGTFGGPAWTAAPDEAAPPPDDDAAALPADHLDLLTGPSVRWLATRDPDGGAHVLPAVCSFVGGRSLAVCPTSEQADDLACDPRATLLVVDRANTGRWLEVRADAALGDGRAVLTPRRVVAASVATMDVRVQEVVFDCADPAALAEFWAHVLDARWGMVDAEWAVVDSAPVMLGFQKVPEPKQSPKNRLHLDVQVGDALAAAERAESLGAHRTGFSRLGEDGNGFVVLQDPEGNEFCFVVDRDGGWDAVLRTALESGTPAA